VETCTLRVLKRSKKIVLLLNSFFK
jgi:hypothetical protein